jgi:hypothetical protein
MMSSASLPGLTRLLVAVGSKPPAQSANALTTQASKY